jgi:hypothetical protein|tara:strand:+ start:592 stop:1593 length:1002 start_codon:yes stop_codon:yes gene_type:complete
MSTIKVNAVESTSSGGVAAKIASINDGALSNRNLLHNSSFEVWQRGTSFASGASGGNRYTADRWSVPNRTRAAQSTDVPAGFKYAILLDREQTGGSEPFTIHQGIEKDNIRFTGSYTLSFYAKSADISSVNINVQDRTTVAEGGTNHSSIVNNQAISITSSWARYTHTFTLSSIALTGTCLRISIGNTSASQNDELLLTGIQLETGSVATDIEKRSFGYELKLCKRYFQLIGKDGTNSTVAAGFTTSNTFFGYGCLPDGEMRAAPTIAVDGTLSHLGYTHTAVAAAASNLTGIGTGNRTFSLQISSTTGTTNLAGSYARMTNAASALTFSAEL